MTDRLNGEQMEILGELTEKRSWYDPNRGIDEREVMEYVEEKLRECNLAATRIPFDENRWNLCVRKGSGPRKLYLTGHMDTESISSNKLESEMCALSQVNGKLFGRGTYDMKGQMMPIIDVLRRVDIPADTEVIAVFLGDEERESLGALALIREIKEGRLPKPDLIFSPEIPTPFRPTGADKKPIVRARRGHVKTNGLVTVPSGHGANDDAPEATEELMEIYRSMTPVHKELERQLKIAQTEDVLPSEKFKIRFRPIENNLLSIEAQVHFLLRQLIIPPNTIRHTISWQKNCLATLSKARPDTKIELREQNELTSYEPYVLPHHTPQALYVARIINDVYGKIGMTHCFIGGRSTSDANLFALEGWPVYEASADGGGAHADAEWVVEADLVRMVQVIEALVTRMDAIHSNGDTL